MYLSWADNTRLDLGPAPAEEVKIETLQLVNEGLKRSKEDVPKTHRFSSAVAACFCGRSATI